MRNFFAKKGRWLFGALLLLSAGVALVVFAVTRQKSVGRLAVDAVEAAHGAAIKAKREQLVALEQDLEHNAKAIAEAKADVRRRKHELKLLYQVTDMPADEVVRRLEKLEL